MGQQLISQLGFLLPTAKGRPRYGAQHVCASLADTLVNRSASDVRKMLECIRQVNVPAVLRSEIGALMRDYHMLQSTYVNIEPRSTTIPRSLAVPSYELAKRSSPSAVPMLAYRSYVLENWRLRDPELPFDRTNVNPVVTFTGTDDEVCFIVTHILIEYAAARLISVYEEWRGADADARSVEEYLRTLHAIREALDAMRGLFADLPRGCRPKVYAGEIRPWLAGFQSVRFEGVGALEGPQTFIGASGAQSSALPAIDAMLGVTHPKAGAYVRHLYGYMPGEHVGYLSLIENTRPTLREIAQESGCIFADKYNACIEALDAFRAFHGEIALQYVEAADTLGTGGTRFREFLKQYREDTRAALIR